MTQPLSAHDLACLVEFGEADAYADLFRHAPAALGLRVQPIGGGILLLAGQLDVLLFNRVVGLGLREPVTEAMLDQIVDIYQRAGLHNFGLQMSPMSQPGAASSLLASRNLVLQDRWVKVYRAPVPPVTIPTELRVACIGRELAPAFASVACRAFGMPAHLEPWLAQGIGQPGWRHYLAFDLDVPVATGALFIRNQVGWLGLGSTLDSHRRRGAQGALMALRMLDAAQAGCEWVITETGEDRPEQPNPSFHNMLRTGFNVAYLRPNYIFRPQA